jgi:hypothetical protein
MAHRTLIAHLAHRKTRTELVMDAFQAAPGRWIDAHTLAHLGGFCAWRSRVSDARKRLLHAGLGIVEWNGEHIESAYRFVPHVPLGPDPSRYRDQTLF